MLKDSKKNLIQFEIIKTFDINILFSEAVRKFYEFYKLSGQHELHVVG